MLYYSRNSQVNINFIISELLGYLFLITIQLLVSDPSLNNLVILFPFLVYEWQNKCNRRVVVCLGWTAMLYLRMLLIRKQLLNNFFPTKKALQGNLSKAIDDFF